MCEKSAEEHTQNVTVTVLEEYDAIWTLNEFLALIAGAIAKIPEEYRATAVVELERPDEEGYGGNLEIRYSRPENAAESAKRIREANEYKREVEARELYEYKRLKAKFE